MYVQYIEIYIHGQLGQGQLGGLRVLYKNYYAVFVRTCTDSVINMNEDEISLL